MWTKNERERKVMVAVVIVTCVALLIWGMYLTGIIVRCPSVREYEGKAPGILSDSAAQILFAEGMPEIGANAEGQAVFKNPHQALHYLKENYGEELAMIEETMRGGSHLIFVARFSPTMPTMQNMLPMLGWLRVETRNAWPL